WTSHFNARHLESKDETLTQRAGIFSNLIADSVDPFDGNLFGLVPIRTDKATGRTTTTAGLLSFSGPGATPPAGARAATRCCLLSLRGPAGKLPAGDLQATVEGRFLDNRLRSTTNFSGFSQKRSF